MRSARFWVGASIVVLFVLVFLNRVMAQAPTHVKTWTFSLPHGSMRIDLQVYPNGVSSLGIGPDQRGHEAPITEQVEPLKKVLAQMPSLGVDPHKLSYLGKMMFGFGGDVTEKLAYACVDSKRCRFNVQSPEDEKVRVLIALLNQSGVFEPYNEAFKNYGIHVRVTEAEKVQLIRFSTVPPRNARDRANGKMLVLGGAYIGMRFLPIDSTPK